MTNMRIQRARYLGEQLTEAMTALASGTHGRDAVLFLERLARLEGYPPEDLTGLDDLLSLIAEARAARGEHAAELGAAAGRVLDVERFLEIGRNLPPADIAGERDSWLRDLLVLATITPWLGKARQLVVKGALAKARAIVDAEPEAFLSASVVAEDRRAHEQPSALGPEAREILSLLADLPLLVIFDRAPEAQSVSRVNAALRAAGAERVEEAEDALDNHDRRAFVRLPSFTGEERMAAAGEAAMVLLSMETGRWVSLQRGGLRSLRFEPIDTSADVSVDVIEGAAPHTLVAGPAGEFVLPTTAVELVLRLRVGPDSRVVSFEPSEP